MVRSQAVALILRFGVAFAFLYAGVSAMLDPFAWIDYLPQGLAAGASATTLLLVFAAGEVLLALWILSGWRVMWPAAAAAVILAAIVALNPAEFQLLFRDLSIAAAAAALALDSYLHAEQKSLLKT